MKMNPASILKASGITCHYYAKDGVSRLPAVAAFVTEESVIEARRKPASPGGLAQVNYGDLIVVRTTPTGERDAVIQPLGSHGAYFIDVQTDIGNRPLRFTGNGMLNAREALVNLAGNGSDIGTDGRNTLAGIQFVFELVSANPDINRYGSRTVADAFLSVMSEGAGSIGLSVSHEDFARKARADLMRAEIGMIDPTHKDALVRNVELDRILIDAGANILSSSSGSMRGVRGDDEEDMRRVVMANEKLSQDVFGKVTCTPLSELSVSIVDMDSSEDLMDDMEDRILSGDWVTAVRADLARVLEEAMPGYKYDFMIAAKDGRDIMIVSDTLGDVSGAIYVYSWPSSDRLPAIDAGGGKKMTISPEEIPDDEEISRLSGILEKMSDHILTDGFANFS
jgi:hypothetical protein